MPPVYTPVHSPQMTPAIQAVTDPRIQRITEMLRTVSGLHDPQEVQLEFSRGFNDEGSLVDGYVSVSRRGLGPGQYKVTRKRIDGAPAYTTQNPWEEWDSIPTHAEGFIGEAIRTPLPKVFPDFELRGDPVLGDQLAPYRSAMVIPLFDEGDALNWSIMLARAPGTFDMQTLEQYLMQGNIIGRMTRSLIIKKDVVRLNERLTQQLDEISSIQRSLLPRVLPEVPGLSIATSYMTSNEAGGDFYDIFPVGDGRWVLLIADVSGHGAGAATVVAMMSAIVHSYHGLEEGPGALFEHLNRQLTLRRIESNFATAFVGYWDPKSRTLEYANAGHHAPLVRDAGGEVGDIVGEHDIPLGILEDRTYPTNRAVLRPGQTVVLYTDGITEAFGPGEEMFGTPRLEDALRACSGAPQCVMSTVHEHLYAFTGSRTRDDDQTLLAFRIEA